MADEDRPADLEDAVAALRELAAAREAAQEFLCECDRPDCHERVVLSVAEYEALRGRRELVLAVGHEESPEQRARRLAGAGRLARGRRARVRDQFGRVLRRPPAARWLLGGATTL